MGNATNPQSAPDDNTVRVFAVSDLHAEWDENEALIKAWQPHRGSTQVTPSLPSKYFHKANDVLIVSGDVAMTLDHIRDTLNHLSQVFGHVFYTTGNNEARIKRKDGYSDSVTKLEAILRIAEEFPNVHTTSCTLFDSITIVPLRAWYEPTFDVSWNKSHQYQKGWLDFRACKWPEDLRMSEEDARPDCAKICQFYTDKNKKVIKQIKKGKKSDDPQTVISFSHFLPRMELLPSSFWLKDKTMPLVVGTNRLEAQIRDLGSHTHVFGHSHINADKTLDGIRYVQNALGHPHERKALWRRWEPPYEPKLIYSAPLPTHLKESDPDE